MHFKPILFNQLLDFIPRSQFKNLVRQYQGDKYVKHFTCWHQMIVILYAQVRGKDSLRDIVTGLRTQLSKWYHLGLKKISRSTLSDANNNRNYRIYEGLFYQLLNRCCNISHKHKFRFKNPLYAIDSTTIDLCLSMFEWAKFRAKKGAIKIHCRYDIKKALPDFMVVSDGKTHDSKVVNNPAFPIEPDSILAVDRAYLDTKWLYHVQKKGAFFVTRTKTNLKFKVIGQHKKPFHKGVISDRIISFTGTKTAKEYPDNLRLVQYYDCEHGIVYNFITNNFKLCAKTIADIYKSRWQIEIFFKWIKQNLKIKSFLGTSKNAVLSQIWIAMCFFLIAAYIKFQTKYKHSLLELTRMIRETLFDRINLIDLLSLNFTMLEQTRFRQLQLTLF